MTYIKQIFVFLRCWIFLLQTICKSLIILRNKDLISATVLLEQFFELFRCQDKVLRKTLYNYIVQDIKNVNQRHKNMKLNTVSILCIPIFPTIFYFDREFIIVIMCISDSTLWQSLFVLQTLQNFMYTMLRDNNATAAKMSLVRDFYSP